MRAASTRSAYLKRSPNRFMIFLEDYTLTVKRTKPHIRHRQSVVRLASAAWRQVPAEVKDLYEDEAKRLKKARNDKIRLLGLPVTQPQAVRKTPHTNKSDTEATTRPPASNPILGHKLIPVKASDQTRRGKRAQRRVKGKPSDPFVLWRPDHLTPSPRSPLPRTPSPLSSSSSRSHSPSSTLCSSPTVFDQPKLDQSASIYSSPLPPLSAHDYSNPLMPLMPLDSQLFATDQFVDSQPSQPTVPSLFTSSVPPAIMMSQQLPPTTNECIPFFDEEIDPGFLDYLASAMSQDFIPPVQAVQPDSQMMQDVNVAMGCLPSYGFPASDVALGTQLYPDYMLYLASTPQGNPFPQPLGVSPFNTQTFPSVQGSFQSTDPWSMSELAQGLPLFDGQWPSEGAY